MKILNLDTFLDTGEAVEKALGYWDQSSKSSLNSRQSQQIVVITMEIDAFIWKGRTQ